MTDTTTAPGFSDKAAESLAAAQRTVESATDQVKETSRHFKETIASTRSPRSFQAFLEDRTRANPLAMLGLAFIAGVIFVRRR